MAESTPPRPPCRIALNLARIDAADVRRGDVVTTDPDLPRSTRLDASLRALPGADKHLRERSPIVLHAGTTRATGRVIPLDEKRFHIVLDEPVPMEGGLGIVVRGFSRSRERGGVLGGGRVLDADAPPLPRKRDTRAREQRVAALDAIEGERLKEAVKHLMDISAPRPVVGAELERRLGLASGDVAKRLEKSGAVTVSEGAVWTTAENLNGLTEELVAKVAAHHRQHPHEPGVSAETIRASMASRAGRELVDFVLARAADRGKVALSGGLVALPSFVAESKAGAEEMAEQLGKALEAAALTGANEADLAGETGQPTTVVRATLARLASDGAARRLGGIWFWEPALSDLRDKVRAHLTEAGKMSVPEFKNLAGVSRKQAIPLLEQLDREGTTRREGDVRVLGAGTR